MDLSPYEKRSLYRFMAVYLGAGLVVVVLFSILFYRIDTESIKDATFAHLRMEAMRIASSAIDAQMKGTPFKVPDEVGCDYLLIDRQGRRIGGCIVQVPAMPTDERIVDGCAWYRYAGAHGHMGIATILLKDCSYGERIRACGWRVAWMAMASYGFLILVGWYLGRLFLRPMREKIEAMDRFVKDATHELNTPVTTILLALQKLENEVGHSPYFKALRMSGRLVSRIYEDLSFLLMNGLEKDREEREPVDIARSVENALDFFAILAERKHITIVRRLQSCVIDADPHHIDLLVKNLIDNAIKYTPYGGVVTITSAGCRLVVEDSGEGMSAEQLERIFERFHRASESEGGFGIGLSIVKRIGDIYGFSVSVSSKKGEGSRFEVRFDDR